MLYGIFGCQLLEIPRHVDVLCHVHESVCIVFERCVRSFVLTPTDTCSARLSCSVGPVVCFNPKLPAPSRRGLAAREGVS